MVPMWLVQLLWNVALFVAMFLAVTSGWAPLRDWILRQERTYGYLLRTTLLMDVKPRTITWFGLGCVAFGAMVGFALFHGMVAMLIGGAIGAIIPMGTVRLLKIRRLRKLEDQLVDGVQTLASSVRAGLNLVQGFELVARNLQAPISQEFGHLVREYEYGVTVDQAMTNAAERIGSSNYRLVFSALQTHRERGGNLGETLDRISESIREIQRLEKRVETLTAQGRAAARWMGMMPLFILAILYLIDRTGVVMLFTDPVGKALLVMIGTLILAGFLWIRQIVSIDI